MSTTYAILLPGDEAAWDSASQAEREAVYARHTRFAEQLAARGHVVKGGAELTHSREARVVRRVGGKLRVSDGPYAESVEQLTGFYLVETDDLDDLIDCIGILEEIGDGAVEVRATTAGG